MGRRHGTEAAARHGEKCTPFALHFALKATSSPVDTDSVHGEANVPGWPARRNEREGEHHRWKSYRALRRVPGLTSAVDSDHMLAISSVGKRLLIVFDIQKLMTSATMGLVKPTLH
jgi:hypothetical protein